MRVVVTGAAGFVGGALVRRLADDPTCVTTAVSRRSVPMPPGVRHEVIEDLVPDPRWDRALRETDVLIHAAARAHILRDAARDPLSEFRRVNVDGILAVARHAAAQGVRRLVFLSSVKVHGESTPPGRPFNEDSPPQPVDAYGQSKLEAERALAALTRETRLEVVVVRPVLVYGPGVGANFLAMMRALHRGFPLPLGAIHNRRSLIGVANLVDFLMRCAQSPAASQQTYLVSDGDDLSTTELLRRTAAALGRRARLLPVPARVVRAVATLAGRSAAAQRLCDSLQVDIAKATRQLGWTPPVSVADGLRKTAEYFLTHQLRAD